jgi:hypothetical protein
MYDYAVEVHFATINPAAVMAARYIGKARKRPGTSLPARSMSTCKLFTGATFTDDSILRCTSFFCPCAQINIVRGALEEHQF